MMTQPRYPFLTGKKIMTALLILGSGGASVAAVVPQATYGPAAAMKFEMQYRGACCAPDQLHCYPQARGIPLADCANLIPMTSSLWTPTQLCADFRRRMSAVPAADRKKGIIVMLKTERCATKVARACAVTTAALEKRSTPLAGKFLIYGVQIKPRDGDNPPGRFRIETGADAWKNQAVAEYRFEQGPGATLVFLNPADASKIDTTNAASLHLVEGVFLKDRGRTPELDRMLREVLQKLPGLVRD